MAELLLRIAYDSSSDEFVERTVFLSRVTEGLVELDPEASHMPRQIAKRRNLGPQQGHG